MSIRLSLYELFAYTIPGVFYQLILWCALVSFGFAKMDWQVIRDLPLSWAFLFLGAGYVIGILMDVPAYRFNRLFYASNLAHREKALEEFKRAHPWLQPEFTAKDCDIVLRVLKLTSIDTAFDIEMHNVASIMLHNIGFGLALLALVFVAYFFLVSANVWNLIIAAALLAFSVVSIRGNAQRRVWFYRGLYDAIAANQLLDHTWMTVKPELSPPPSPATPAPDTSVE